MGKKPNVDENAKFQIGKLLLRGYSTKKIKELYNVSDATISRIRTTIKKNEFPIKKRKLGRPELLSRREKRLLIIFVRRKRFTSIRKIAEEFSNQIQKKISRTTISKILKNYHIRTRYARRKPLTTKRIRKERLRFCRKYKRWKSSDWKNVIFTDETIIRTDPPGRKRVLCKDSEVYLPQNTLTCKVGGGESVMFWGAIGKGKKLMFYDIKGKLNSEKYYDFLNDNCEILSPV